MLSICILGILTFCSHNVAAQCKGDFRYESVSSQKGSNSGRIEVSLANPAVGNYIFKLFQIDGIVALVQSKQASSAEKISFENLKPATYLVKVEWDGSCHSTLGGRDGIIITEKDQER